MPKALQPAFPRTRLGAMAMLMAAFGCATAPEPPTFAEPAVHTGVRADVMLPGIHPDPFHRVLRPRLIDSTEGWIESEPLNDGKPFTEALPSWSVLREAAFIVEIRMQRDAGSDWSPWLRIGDWRVESRDESVRTKFAGGKVAVDVATLLEPHYSCQLRFQGVERQALTAADIDALMVLTDTRDLTSRVASAATEPWPRNVVTNVAPRSQRSVGEDIGGRICSPTSVSMVAAYHGKDVPTREMAESLLDPHYDIYGNWNRAIQGPAELGLPGQLARISSWEVVHAYLADGIPLIASIKAKEGELRGAPYAKTAGHLLVVTGLGPGGAVHVNDPAARYPLDVPRVYQRADMEKVWFENGGVTYVFRPATVEPSL